MKRCVCLVSLSAVILASDVVSRAQVAVGPNINMSAGSDYFLQRANELAYGVSSLNPDHHIAFWNDWRTIDQPDDTSAGPPSQNLFARLFRFFRKPAVKTHMPTVMAAAEGWTAVGFSNNGAWNWSTGLVPGYPGDTSPEGAALRAEGYEAMADPWVSCDPVHCHGVTIAFTRGGGSGLVYFRYTDFNDSETGHNWRLTIAPTILRTGNNSLPGLFNDKPTVIAGPNGRVLIASVEFDGQDKGGKFQSKVMVTRSADAGMTWSAFQKISAPGTRNQSPFFVIDPNNANRVFVGWRVFSDHAIVGRASFDGGAIWLPMKPRTIISNFQAFDQPGKQMQIQLGDYVQQFRTNAYVTGGMDGSGALHVAVAERVDPATGQPSSTGTPRIVVTSSYDGGSTWTPRRPVALAGTGPQFMPTMTIVGAPRRPGDPSGRTRAEIFLAYYAADPADIPAASPGPIATADVRFHMYLSHADSWNVDAQRRVNFSPATMVSRYTKDALPPHGVVTAAGFGVTSENRGYPIFYAGTGGFTGDYNIVTARVPYVKTATGGWRATTALDEDPSTNELPAPSVQVAWADTRNVIIPNSPPPLIASNLDTYAWWNYSPPGTGSLSKCNPGSRNQDPYLAEATTGVLAAAPLTFKEPNLPRSYPLYVQNKTNLQQAWRATIDLDADASFTFLPLQPGQVIRKEADFVIEPYSTVTGTVFVAQSFTETFHVTFQKLSEVGGMPLIGPGTSTVVTLNTSGGTDPAAATQEFHDPLVNQDVLVYTHLPTSDGDLPTDPYVQDDPDQNPLGQNPLGQNPLGQNPFGQNPLGQNTSPKEITDYTFRIKNGGSTHSAYKAIASLQQQLDQDLYKFQIIINRVSRAPGLSRKDCSTWGNQFQPLQISSVQTPLGQNPLGQNPLGQNPFGQNPFGQNPFGQNPFGQNPFGQNAIVSDNSTFYVAPAASSSPSARLKREGSRLAGGWARHVSRPRLVRVSGPAEYVRVQDSSLDFTVPGRTTDEVWYTLRVFRTRDLLPGDTVFSLQHLTLGVFAQAPNVEIRDGVVIVTDPPAAFEAPDLIYTGALTGIPPGTSPGWTVDLPPMPVRNAGTAAAGPFRQALYLRSATTFPEGLLLGAGPRTTDLLAPEASTTVPGAAGLLIPRTVPPGTYDACAVLDHTDEVPESNEANNFTCVTLTIGSPDLIVESVTHSPATPTTIEEITFTATVRNQGGGSSLASQLAFSLPGEEFVYIPVPVLTAGQAFVATRTGTFAAGTHTFTVDADAFDEVAESDETNNATPHTFTVVLPMLAFTVQPSNALAGATITPPVQVSVANAVGQLLPAYAGAVTLAIDTNPGPGSLIGTTTRTVVGGVATFDDLSISRFGNGYTLRASAPNAQDATSNSFNVLPRAGGVLVYGPSLAPTTPNESTIAADLGFTVTVRTATEWSAMTQSEFAAFRAIVFGDPDCSTDPGVLATAAATEATWSPAVNGPKVVIGTDAQHHGVFVGENGVNAMAWARQLTSNAIAFAAREPTRTGMYMSLSCYYAFTTTDTPVQALAGFGSFTALGSDDPVFSNAVTVNDPTHPVVAGFVAPNLSNWGKSVHETISAMPSTWIRIASQSAFEGTPERPYIVAEGGRRLIVTVRDASGAVLPGVTVDAINVSTGATVSASTDEVGVAQFVGLVPGTYTVRIDPAGAPPVEVTGVQVSPYYVTRITITGGPAGPPEEN